MEKPILFSTEMVQALLDGRKTQTRRTTGLDEINRNPDQWIFDGFAMVKKTKKTPESERSLAAVFWNNVTGERTSVKSPYGQHRDMLWVRETFAAIDYGLNRVRYAFKADDSLIKDEFKWKPSIHMPKDAARIWLNVKDVRVERLHEITEKDIIAEGIRVTTHNGRVCLPLGEKNSAIEFLIKWGFVKGGPKETSEDYFKAFWASKWCEINGRDSYDANPWVWVVEFKMLSN